MKKSIIALAISTSVLLTGCGGGDGDSDQPAPAPIDQCEANNVGCDVQVEPIDVLLPVPPEEDFIDPME